MFENKVDALAKLLEVIDKDLISESVVLAISKNATFYAKEIGLRNGMLEGDFLFIEKVKSPINKQTALAAVSETRDYVLIDELINSFEITDDYLFGEIQRVYEEKILEDIYQFRAGEGIISLKNKNVLLVDEGANTGLTLLCAIKSCISKNVSSISVAVPIIAKETAEMVEKLVDHTFFGKVVEDFVDTQFYFKEYK
jgi:putative phosphoribosyl transferase